MGAGKHQANQNILMLSSNKLIQFWITRSLFPSIFFRDALDKAEKATERLATVSKDVIKALEIANPKETKK